MVKWLALSFGLALCACQPNDQRVKTARQLMDEGQVLEMTQSGWRHSGCQKGNKPNFQLLVNDEQERARVVLGTQGTIISLGLYNCYQVGSRTGIERFGENAPWPGGD